MNKIKVILAVLILFVLISSGFAVFSITNPEKNVFPQNIDVLNQKGNSTMAANTTKQELNVSNIKISSEIETTIKSLDSKKASKNINLYKHFINEMDMTTNYRNTVEKNLKKSKNLQDVLIAYNFLYDQYGIISELEGLLQQKNAGKTWPEVFEAYKKTSPKYVPKNFKHGYLSNLFKDGTVSVSDVMVADRIAQKKKKTFEEVIALKKGGKSWKEIKSGYGIINTEEKMIIVPIEEAQVQDFIKSTKQTKEKVIQFLAITKKMNLDEEETKKIIKESKTEEDVYGLVFENKYQ